MERHEVRARIESVGIIPAIRVSSAEDTRFAATAIHCAGISVAESPRLSLMRLGSILICDETFRRCSSRLALFSMRKWLSAAWMLALNS